MTTKKTPMSWAQKLEGLAPTIEKVAFQPTAAAFDHKLHPAAHGAPRAVVKAKVRAAQGAQGVLVRVPTATLERLKAHTVGSHTVSIVALADWALDYLEQTGQAIETNEKE
ncbi:hypothetical protein [Stenotrophomonas sp. Marseille-Q4652]|uniref:hypothetical protein n=1 Tax=Stenotrophomonas sp. Marseille-Q4652 TaxID=2866595 RepID=UPI001CE3DE9C|nr:hypothetical protein [Stenotrophomonas sp. Marseille-Q4652]